jgi:hypothetical protein
MAIAIALPPDRPPEPDVAAVAVLITVGVALLAVGIPPGDVSPPPSPPPEGATGTVGAGAVTLVAAVAVAECFVEPAATAPAGAAIAPMSTTKQVAARTRSDDLPALTSTHPYRSDASGCSIAGVVGGRL